MDLLLKTYMNTMTNKECIEKAPDAYKTVIKPSQICAGGRPRDDNSSLDNDSCTV